MLGATAQSVKSALEKPVFILRSIGIPYWGFDDGEFVWQENALAKGVLAAALFECASLFNCQANQEAKGIGMENRCIFF